MPGPWSLMWLNASEARAVLVLRINVGIRGTESTLRSAPCWGIIRSCPQSPWEIKTPSVVAFFHLGVNDLGSETAKESRVQVGVLWTSLPSEFGELPGLWFWPESTCCQTHFSASSSSLCLVTRILLVPPSLSPLLLHSAHLVGFLITFLFLLIQHLVLFCLPSDHKDLLYISVCGAQLLWAPDRPESEHFSLLQFRRRGKQRKQSKGILNAP